ncbi:MAG: hypothetical protein PWP46_1192 [Fusobacteriaceae bacterium]|jgi:DNA-binding transcriptional ArsR family regulator|nr:hypothetical protein [Fusobacteriaceae bacterium]
MSKIDEVFKALSDKTRRDILELLKKQDLTAGEIAEHFNITKPSISHHLKLLKHCNLIDSRREGQQIIYSINMSVMEDIFNTIFNIFKRGESNE